MGRLPDGDNGVAVQTSDQGSDATGNRNRKQKKLPVFAAPFRPFVRAIPKHLFRVPLAIGASINRTSRDAEEKTRSAESQKDPPKWVEIVLEGPEPIHQDSCPKSLQLDAELIELSLVHRRRGLCH